MKNTLRIAIAIGASTLAAGVMPRASAAPLVSLDDNIDIFFKGTATTQYNSNVLSATGGVSKKDDYILTLSPGFELDYGRNTPTTVTINFREDFLRYLQNSNLDIELSNVFVNATHTQDAWTTAANFSYVQAYTNTPSAITPTLNTILRSDVINAGIKFDYKISEKFFTKIGGSFSQTEYLGSVANQYQNSQAYNAGGSIYYVYSPKLDIGLDYSYNQIEPQNSLSGGVVTVGRSRYTNQAGVNFVIKEWEKLSGSIGFGVISNHIDDDPTTVPPTPESSDTTFNYKVNLTYQFTPKISFNLNGNRNYYNGAQGQNIEATIVNFGGKYQYSDTIALDANFIGFTHSQYLQDPNGRVDDTITSGFNVSWSPTTYLVLSAGYSYFMNSSNISNTLGGATYNINLVSISGTIRY